ncbi:chromatin remodeling complex protein [Rhizoctonia solani AG-1 IA]|uniref:Chromatin remodeling complex protein n=1 Tax=Thanatephorus cucumeris (strain AG1-IA) TaxID=983506 RepID=L8WZ04_THACA|nr:chromatin remodeling complex protein [Rhizoctonia solani AG-1 IA]
MPRPVVDGGRNTLSRTRGGGYDGNQYSTDVTIYTAYCLTVAAFRKSSRAERVKSHYNGFVIDFCSRVIFARFHLGRRQPYRPKMRFSLCLLASAVLTIRAVSPRQDQCVVCKRGGKDRMEFYLFCPGVADGAYILSVLAPDHAFDFVRIDVDNNTVSAHPHVLGTPFELSVTGPTLSYPLTLSPRSKNVYFVPREGFNLAGMFQNPVSPALTLLPSPLLTEDGRLDDVDDGSNGCDGNVHAETHDQTRVTAKAAGHVWNYERVGFGVTERSGRGFRASGINGRCQGWKECSTKEMSWDVFCLFDKWTCNRVYDNILAECAWGMGMFDGSSEKANRVSPCGQDNSVADRHSKADEEGPKARIRVPTRIQMLCGTMSVARANNSQAKIRYPPLFIAVRTYIRDLYTLRGAPSIDCSGRQFATHLRARRQTATRDPIATFVARSKGDNACWCLVLPDHHLLLHSTRTRSDIFPALHRSPRATRSALTSATMPLVRRKQVAMHSLPPELIDNPNDTRDVFYLEETGEIFLDYESYASRMSFYKMKVFQCETTGKGGLDYFQALHSEQTESSNLLARFPEPLKVAVLRSVQWRAYGSSSRLFTCSYYLAIRYRGKARQSRRPSLRPLCRSIPRWREYVVIHAYAAAPYADRPPNLEIFVDIQGEKYWARILKVFPPKALVATWSAYNGNNVSSSTNPNMLTPSRAPPNGLSPLNPNYTNPNSPSGSNHYSPHNEHPPVQVDPTSIAHRIGGDLSLPPQEALAKDDPAAYFYQVQLIEEGDEDDLPEANGAGASSSGGTKWAGSTMEVQMGVMSKSILRRFIRECVTRDAAIASPWVVKPALATKYGLETEMPSAMRKSMERAKAGELEKRKKVWEDKEDRPSKKVKKQGDTGDDSGRATPVGKVKETPTPAPVRRYPIEDLDVVLTDRDRKASDNKHIRTELCLPSDVGGPVNNSTTFQSRGTVRRMGPWCMRKVPDGLVDINHIWFEQALNHVYTPPNEHKFPRVVPLMAEIHGTLLLHIAERADKLVTPVWVGDYGPLYDLFNDQAIIFRSEYHKLKAVMPREEAYAQADATNKKQFAKFGGPEEDVQAHVWRTKLGQVKPTELSIEELVELVRLNSFMYPEWREGVIGGPDEIAYATPETFPRVRSVVGQILKPPPIAKPAEQSDAPKIATLDDPDSDSEVGSNGGGGEDELNYRWGWMALTPRDKLELLAFLADLAMTSRGIRSFMDECDARLTTLRKEKIEVNRERKRVAELLEEAGVSVTKMEEKMNSTANQNGDAEEMGDAASETGSASTTPLPESGTTTRRKSRTAPSSTAPNSHSGTPESTHPVNQRAAARAQAAEHKGLVKQRQAHIDEAAKLEKQLAEIEREFRQLLGATRMKPLGKDRFHNRLWWFDGIAGVGATGKVSEGKGNKGKGRTVEKEREREAQGVGRIFLQGPEKGEWEFVMNGRDERAVQARRIAEEGEEFMLEPGEWAMYIEEFIAWLNPKGTRELHLKNSMTKWGEPLMAAVGKRSLCILLSIAGSDGRSLVMRSMSAVVHHAIYIDQRYKSNY